MNINDSSPHNHSGNAPVATLPRTGCIQRIRQALSVKRVLVTMAKAMGIVALSALSALLTTQGRAPAVATSVVGAKEANRDWSLSMDTQETGRQELSKALCDLAPESGSWTAQLYASTLALTRAHLGPVDPLEDDHRAVQLLRSDCWARVGDFNRFSWKPEQEAGATAYTLMPSHDSYADAYVPGLHEPMDKHRV